MLDTTTIVQTQTRPAAVIHVTIPRDEIRTAMPAAMQELMGTLGAQGIQPVGPLFSHHFQMNPDTFDFEVGVPVDEVVAPSGRVKPGELPATTVVRTVYTGPYEGLGDAWGEFSSLIEADGHATAADLWESYLSGPESDPDPSTWRTELNRPLVSR